MFIDAAAFEEFRSHFEKEDDCVRALFETKWPDGFRCPRCEHRSAYVISTRRLPLFECRSCQAQTSLIAGTVMEGSRTPLRLWFQAIYLHAKPFSINALRLSSIIGVTYKTAWLICHKIRHAMSHADSHEILTGIVRVTEAVYCKRLTPYFDWHKQEQPLLIGSSENEKGEIVRIKIKQQSKKTQSDKYDYHEAAPFIQQHVDPEAATQTIVNRRSGKKTNKTLLWLSYGVTWWLGGLFRGIGPKHLQVYLDQYCYLWNREEQSMFSDLLRECSITKTVTYPLLTGSSLNMRSMRRSRLSIRGSQMAG
jgi:hypothetical protein